MTQVKIYIEVRHPDQLDDDNGRRGFDAGRIAETLGPIGLQQLFHILSHSIESQARYFSTLPKSAKIKPEYLQDLATAAERCEELAQLFHKHAKNVP